MFTACGISKLSGRLAVDLVFSALGKDISDKVLVFLEVGNYYAG